jgi:hypothetical protein
MVEDEKEKTLGPLGTQFTRFTSAKEQILTLEGLSAQAQHPQLAVAQLCTLLTTELPRLSVFTTHFWPIEYIVGEASQVGPGARLLHASYTPLTRLSHASHTPLTYTPLTRLLHKQGIAGCEGGGAGEPVFQGQTQRTNPQRCARQAPGTKFTCFTDTKVQILTQLQRYLSVLRVLETHAAVPLQQLVMGQLQALFVDESCESFTTPLLLQQPQVCIYAQAHTHTHTHTHTHRR